MRLLFSVPIRYVRKLQSAGCSPDDRVSGGTDSVGSFLSAMQKEIQ